MQVAEIGVNGRQNDQIEGGLVVIMDNLKL